MKFKYLVFAALFFSIFLFVDSKIRAHEGESEATGSPKPTEIAETPKPTGTTRFEDRFSPKPSGTPEPFETFHLTEGHLKSCEARKGSIMTRTKSLMELVIRMVGKFDAIVTRVKEFYTNKVLPSGKVVPNYDELVADIAAKKALVDTAIAGLPDTDTFDCTGDNPKGLLTEFRTDMRAVKKALHEYRTSIKNLIVAVKSVVDGTESPGPSETAEATRSPVPTP